MLVDVRRPTLDVPHPEQYRCWVDGEEVTDRCIRADDEEGYADVYLLTDEGKRYTWDDLVPAWTRLHGKIRLEIRSDD